jgi:hypothetical protein
MDSCSEDTRPREFEIGIGDESRLHMSVVVVCGKVASVSVVPLVALLEELLLT